MKQTKKYNYAQYKRSLQIATISSLAFFVLLFGLYPRFSGSRKPPPVYFAPQLQLMQIPPTRQPEKAGPPPSKPVIPVAADEVDFLADVPIEIARGDNLADSASVTQFIEGIPLTTQPRQIIEVVPQNPGNAIRGEIILLLKIGANGKMNDFKLVANSTRSTDALNSALQAARRSRWESTKVDGRVVEYWIEKFYRFNM